MPLNLVTCLFHKQVRDEIQENLIVSLEGVINPELITRIEKKIGKSDYEIKDYFREDINEIKSLIYDDEIENHYFLIYSTDILMIGRFYSLLKHKSFKVIVVDKDLNLNIINTEIEMKLYSNNSMYNISSLTGDFIDKNYKEFNERVKMFESNISLSDYYTERYSCGCGNLHGKEHENEECILCNSTVKYIEYEISSDLIVKAVEILKSLKIEDAYTKSKINESIGTLVKAVDVSVRESRLVTSCRTVKVK